MIVLRLRSVSSWERGRVRRKNESLFIDFQHSFFFFGQVA